MGPEILKNFQKFFFLNDSKLENDNEKIHENGTGLIANTIFFFTYRKFLAKRCLSA